MQYNPCHHGVVTGLQRYKEDGSVSDNIDEDTYGSESYWTKFSVIYHAHKLYCAKDRSQMLC